MSAPGGSGSSAAGRFGFLRLVAAGGYRSGSTLQYNLMGEYLERIGAGQRFGLVDPDDVESLVRRTAGSDRISVVKSHHAVGDYQSFVRPNAWIEEMESGRARALTSSRSEHEVRRSMCRKFGLTDATLESSPLWLANTVNAKKWRELGAHEQTYELLTMDPVGAIRDACSFLGLPWSRREADAAAVAVSLSASISAMHTLEQGAYDPVTLLHWDHVDESRLRPE